MIDSLPNRQPSSAAFATTALHADEVRPAILDFLRLGTQDVHKRVEAGLGLIERNYEPGEYKALLSRFHGFHSQVEARLFTFAGWDGSPVDLPARRKTVWLETDLHYFGLSADDIYRLPAIADLPALETLPQALGWLYVAEGSTMGGKFLSSHFRKKFGYGPANGGAFFNGYGEATWPMWKAFQNILAERLRTPDQMAAGLNGARDLFLALAAWMAAKAPGPQ